MVMIANSDPRWDFVNEKSCQGYHAYVEDGVTYSQNGLGFIWCS